VEIRDMFQTRVTRRLLVLVLLLIVPVLFAPAGAGKEDESLAATELLKLGDTYLKEKTFKKALEYYRRFLTAHADAPERFGVHERVARAMIGLRQFHQAIKALEAVIPTAPAGSLDRARLEGLAGKTWADYRGGSKKCVAYLDAALAVYRKDVAKTPGLQGALIETLFSRAKALNYSWDYALNFDAWRKAHPDVGKDAVNEKWQKFVAAERLRQDASRRERVEATHAEILERDGGRGHVSARSLFLLGSFRINAAGSVRTNPVYYPSEPAEETPEAIQKALNDYVAWVKKGLTAWRQLVATISQDDLADDALFFVAHTIHHRLSDLPRAMKAYETFVETFPDSAWVSDAKKYLQDIRKEDITIHVARPFLPGTNPKFGLAVRNVDELKMTAYRLDLPALLRKNVDLADAAMKKLRVADLTPHTRWTVETGAPKDATGIQKEIEIPFSAAGAYLILAEGNKRTARALLIISRLAMVQKLALDRNLYYVTDAETGEPKAAASVTILGRTRKAGLWLPRVLDGTTDEQGVFEPDLTKMRNFSSSWRFSAVGWAGDDVALTYGYYNRRRPGETYRVFAFTDRPVYRPDQTVHFKAVIRKWKDGDHVNVPGKPVTVRITDPRNGKLYEKTLVTNAHGSISGDLAIDAEPRLGVYNIRIWIDGRQYYTYSYSGATFRVEEYKKPEYEVTVDTSAARVKPGDSVEATIKAKYYFGAPVAGADVDFRVFRIPYRHVIVPQIKYRWYHDVERLYGRRSWDWQREAVLHAQGKTDDDGNLVISFPSKSYDDGRDSKYLIEARVVDKSRREIRGSGHVFATEKPFFVAVEPERRVYRPGDRAKFRIRAVTANEKPVAGKGDLVISMRRDGEPDEQGKPTVFWDEIAKVPASTDAKGEGRVEFIPDRLGAYKFEYVTKSEDGVEVRGGTTLWVVSEKFRGGTYRFQNVQLVADKRTYAMGEKVQLLVNTQFDDVPVLLTAEADGKILSRQLVRTHGRSAVLELDASKSWVPNVYLKAVFIRGSRVYQDTVEIVVPPEDRFLDVSLTGAKETYLPGEKATFQVTVKDAAGEPVATETAVSFFDKSILYIQADLTPDVRKFFYGSKRSDAVRIGSSFDWSFRARDVLKPEYTWTKYRTHRIPEAVNPWRYSYVTRQTSWGHASGGGKFGGRGGRRNRSLGIGSDGGPPPAASAPMDKMADSEEMESGRVAGAEMKRKAGKKQGGGSEAAPKLRSFFADSCFWNAHLVTGPDGKGEIKVTFPDSLTTWTAIARVISDDTAVGSANAEPVVKKNLLVRLAAPRFFTETDEVVLSGIIRNDLPDEMAVRIVLKLEGGTLELLPVGELSVEDQTIRVPSGKEQRVDWRCRVLREGEAKVTVSALTSVESDAMQMVFPSLPHAVEKFEGRSGSFVKAGALHEGEGSQTVSFVLPEKMDPRLSRIEVSVAPSLASMLLEPLPYLADYPYGCTEQTLSRFVPSVIVKKTLIEMGVDVDTMKVPEVRDVPGGWWGTPQARKLKLLKKGDMDRIVKAGLARLYDFQHADGGWGWWKGGRSDDFMTALVLRGLLLARDADVKIDQARLDRAANFLLGMVRTLNLAERREIGDRIRGDAYAHLAEALLRYGKLDAKAKADMTRLIDALYAMREDLAASGRAYLALSLHHMGDAERAGILLDNLTDHALVDAENGTARFGRTSGYRTWRDDAVESTAWTLQAYLAVRPDSPLVPQMMRWLTRNRRGAHWASTRDTASAVLGLAAYLRQTRELDADVTVKVEIGDSFSRSVHFTRANALTGEDRIILQGESLRPGKHEIKVSKTGKGNVYFAAYATYLTREDNIKGAGHEIHVERRFHLLVPKTVEVERKVWIGNHYETRKVDVIKHERVALESGATLNSGDLIEVELLVRSDNDYRYVVFEDYKAAGCEPVQLRSGRSFGGLWTNMELRDEKVAFFASRLPQTAKGEAHTIRYRLRCEVPGLFSAMPVRAWAMYLPEVRAISDEFKLGIVDKTEK
jgi:alpha-2-macroglobulin